MKQSQAWSMDIMLAFIIFIGTIFVFYSIISNKQDGKEDELRDDALRVMESIASKDSNVSIVDGSTINTTKLENLLGRDYSEIKNKIRTKNEFCIFLEDEDGNVIYITIDPEQGGIGSDKINISDIPCG